MYYVSVSTVQHDRDDTSDRRRQSHGSKYNCKPACNIDQEMLSKLRGRAQDTIQSLVPLDQWVTTISWESELMVSTPGFTWKGTCPVLRLKQFYLLSKVLVRSRWALAVPKNRRSEPGTFPWGGRGKLTFSLPWISAQCTHNGMIIDCDWLNDNRTPPLWCPSASTQSGKYCRIIITRSHHSLLTIITESLKIRLNFAKCESWDLATIYNLFRRKTNSDSHHFYQLLNCCTGWPHRAIQPPSTVIVSPHI